MTTALAIPENLQAYGPEILAGLAAADRRRHELANAWGYPTRQLAAGPVVFAELPQPVEQTQLNKLAAPRCITAKPNPATLQPVKSGAIPDCVKVYGGLHIAAWQANHSGAYRLYVLAKVKDDTGSGAIKKADLKAAADALKINERNYWRWLADAEKIGLISRWPNLPDSFILVSHEKAAAILFSLAATSWAADPKTKDIPRPAIYGRMEKHRAEIELKALFRKGWRGLIWQAFYKSHFEKIYTDRFGHVKTHIEKISQNKLSELTGVAPATQRLLQQGMTISPNYALTGLPVDQLAGIKEFGLMPAPQKFYNMETEEWEITRRIPDTRKAGKAIKAGNVGRSRKIQKFLNNPYQNSLCIYARAAKFELGKINRLIYSTKVPGHIAKAERVLQTIYKRPDDPNEVYIYKRKAKHTPTTLYDRQTVGVVQL